MLDADTYDSYFVPALFEPWSRELIKRAQVWNGDRVLDVCTGTGIVACRIAATGATVTGLELAADRVARARLRARDESVPVKFVEGDAAALPFRGPDFDLVTCQQGLQFVPDRAQAVREMRRVIAPGGRAVIACWCAHAHQGPYFAIDEVAHRHTGKRYPTPFTLGDAAELNQLLVDAKFFAVNVETVTRQTRFPDPERWAALMLQNISGAPASDAALADGLAAIAAWIDGNALVFPLVSLIATARVKT